MKCEKCGAETASKLKNVPICRSCRKSVSELRDSMNTEFKKAKLESDFDPKKLKDFMNMKDGSIKNAINKIGKGE